MKFGLIKLFWNFETKGDNPKETKEKNKLNTLNQERLLQRLQKLLILYLCILSDIVMFSILR